MTTSLPSAEFLRAFAERADASGILRFDAFVNLALYHPELGYYRKPRRRVGYESGTDFFTASTSGPVFGELISAACEKLIGPSATRECTFVEVGAESHGGVLSGIAHPFHAVRTIMLGETLELSGRCVVFSNELFDAQPFRRFQFQHGAWRELGVKMQSGALLETQLAQTDLPAELRSLPSIAPQGYTIDAPIAATRLTELITRGNWTGLFVAFDYGKWWQELVEATPAGTARANYRHTQSNDLLARPGEQDLTCHVCWDWLMESLAKHGFAAPRVDSQESFLIRNAERYLAQAIAADAARLTTRKQSLLQLIHGAHLGHKFQVLHGLR